eukprot:757379-Hanusia_phi.AAC.3
MQTEFQVNMLHPVDLGKVQCDCRNHLTAALEITNAGDFIYVASYNSQVALPLLFSSRLPRADYGPHRSDYVAPGALTSLALTSDNSRLLVTSASEHALLVFCVSPLNGELKLYQVTAVGNASSSDLCFQTVRDEMVLDGRIVDGLRGAAMVAISGQTAVVAAAIDNAISVFSLSPGCSEIKVR